jgi:hypothetical protein
MICKKRRYLYILFIGQSIVHVIQVYFLHARYSCLLFFLSNCPHHQFISAKRQLKDKLSELFTEECHRPRVVFSLKKEEETSHSRLAVGFARLRRRRAASFPPPELLPTVESVFSSLLARPPPSQIDAPGFAPPTPAPPAHLLPGRPPPWQR